MVFSILLACILKSVTKLEIEIFVSDRRNFIREGHNEIKYKKLH